MNETTALSSPLLPCPVSSAEGSPARSYGSAEDVPALQESALDYDGGIDDGMRSDMSIADLATKTTALQTFIHLVKGYIGPGCLSLPWAVSQVGFVCGAGGIAVMAIWSSYNCWTVVKIKRYIERANEQRASIVDRAEVGSETSSLASSALTYPCVGSGRTETNLSMCTVFFSFIGENIYAVCQLVPDSVPRILLSHGGVMTVALPFVLGLSFIPTLNALTPIMVIGTVMLFSGFGVLGYVISAEWNEKPANPVEMQWKEAPLALCAILYSFEGICLILPIESTMAEPRKFKRVFFSAMAVTATVFATVATLCVYAFGKVTNGSVTAFLIEEYKDDASLIVFIMIANTLTSFSVLFTYPLQLFPTFELVGPRVAKLWWKLKHRGKYSEPEQNDYDEEHDLSGFDPMPTLPEHDVASLSSHDNEDMHQNFDAMADDAIPIRNGAVTGHDTGDATRLSMISNITEPFPEYAPIAGDSWYLRMGLVLLTYAVASIIPNVQVLISLAGALAGSSTALLIPPVLELALIDHLEATPDMTASPRLVPPSQQNSPKASTFRRLCRCDISGKKFWRKKLKCFTLFWLGFVFMIIGAYASVSDIVAIWLKS
ncbi:hypothetical protein ACHAXT_007380 [Thalassiosira profunda]